MEFLPIEVLFVGVIIVLAYDAICHRQTGSKHIWYSMLTFTVLISAAAAALLSLDYFKGDRDPSYLLIDEFYLVIAVSLIAGSLLMVILAATESGQHSDLGVLYALVLIATTGGIVVGGCNDFLSLLIGLELLTIPTYAMVAFRKDNKFSMEAAMKYFLLGSFATATMIYGISLYYGATGSLALKGQAGLTDLGKIGIVMFVFAVGFKISTVPFHAWTPDVYYGAHTSVTTFLATVSKTVGFAVAFKVFFVAFGSSEYAEFFVNIFCVLAILTMTLGNLAALSQTSVKRMLAYSSIAQAGYILIALASYDAGDYAVAAGLYHMIAHLLSKGAAFFAVGLALPFLKNDQLDGFKGLGKKDKVLASGFTVALLSLSGIPPLVGFFGKFYLVLAALEAGGWVQSLAFVLVANSVVSVFYYFRIIYYMFWFDPEWDYEPRRSTVGLTVLTLVSSAIVLLGVFAEPLFSLLQDAASALLA